MERDLTDYSPLFRTAQTGESNLGNLVNGTYTGIITGSARVLLYPASAVAPAPRTADAVLPLSTAPGGAALLATTASVLAPTFSLPANVEAAYLDVITQSQSGDEFWYTCVPDDVAGELQSCGGTAFREAEITIDGQPAGVAPVYPWIFTGGIDPLLWRPIPGVQTLNFLPYRVDLTPFAGVLSNGQPHQVGVGVYNADNYFLVAASLLLYLDHGAEPRDRRGDGEHARRRSAPDGPGEPRHGGGRLGHRHGDHEVRPRVRHRGLRQHLARQGGDRGPADGELLEPAAVRHHEHRVRPEHHPGRRSCSRRRRPSRGAPSPSPASSSPIPLTLDYLFRCQRRRLRSPRRRPSTRGTTARTPGPAPGLPFFGSVANTRRLHRHAAVQRRGSHHRLPEPQQLADLHRAEHRRRLLQPDDHLGQRGPDRRHRRAGLPLSWTPRWGLCGTERPANPRRPLSRYGFSGRSWERIALCPTFADTRPTIGRHRREPLIPRSFPLSE